MTSKFITDDRNFFLMIQIEKNYHEENYNKEN